MADYPPFDAGSLTQSADLIIEGTALSSEPTVLTPRYEGDTAQENPILGLSEEEQKRVIADDEGVPATAVTFRVDTVHKGAVGVGQEIVILQTGGVVDGVTYKVREEDPLKTQESYLIFAGKSHDGAFYILGGSAGTYISTGDDTFSAVNPDTAPFSEIDSAEVANLAD
ncbi:hypothetical protein [Mycetocola tolaasinivorans]|nr:hypothetical protein [Mycetocola tolaasinivorans]